MLSHAGGINGKTAGALAVAFRWAERALRVVHRARVNVETQPQVMTARELSFLELLLCCLETFFKQGCCNLVYSN